MSDIAKYIEEQKVLKARIAELEAELASRPAAPKPRGWEYDKVGKR